MTHPNINVRLKRAPDCDFFGSPAWRLLCRHANCRGELGYAHDHGAELGWFVNLWAGFIESAPGVWRLGRHAAKSVREAPRRPKRFPFDIAPFMDITYREPDGHIVSSYRTIPLYPEFPQMILCPRCHAPSRLSVEQLVEIGGKPAADLIAS